MINTLSRAKCSLGAKSSMSMTWPETRSHSSNRRCGASFLDTMFSAVMNRWPRSRRSFPSFSPDTASKAAVACGLSDYWELRAWNDDFRLSPDQIYHSLFEFISNATTASDLEALWLLSCGIHSWYTQDGRNGAQNIFNACVAQAQKIGVDFSSLAMKLTPQWISIISHQSEQQKISPDEKSYAEQRIQEFEDIKTQYADISIDETISALPAVRTSANPTAHYNVILEKVSSDDSNIKENLTSVLMSVYEYLRSKEWTYERYDSLILVHAH